MAEQNVQKIKNYMAYRLHWLQNLPEHQQKAALANLRRGIGKAPGDLPELWGIFLQDLPEELESRTGKPTAAEWAVYLALTLYALHQQGHPLPADSMHKPDVSLGKAIRKLVPVGERPEDSSVLKRFNALATAGTMPERFQHLRGIIQLLRAKGIALDYLQLAADLFWLQKAVSAAQVRLRWGQDYYYTPRQEAENVTATEKGE